MGQKAFMTCLAIAPFAVVPSLASAKPVLTEPTGTVLSPTGEPKIVGTNVGNTTMVTSIGTLTCTTATLTGRLEANTTAGGTQGEIDTAKFGGTGETVVGAPEPECTWSTSLLKPTTVTPEINMPWCLSTAGNTASSDTFTVEGGPCGSPRAIKFDLDVTTVGTCHYSRTEAVEGTITTDSAGTHENTAAITSVAWNKIEPSPGLCPSVGELTMRFSMETENGTAISISS